MGQSPILIPNQGRSRKLLKRGSLLFPPEARYGRCDCNKKGEIYDFIHEITKWKDFVTFDVENLLLKKVKRRFLYRKMVESPNFQLLRVEGYGFGAGYITPTEGTVFSTSFPNAILILTQKTERERDYPPRHSILVIREGSDYKKIICTLVDEFEDWYAEWEELYRAREDVDDIILPERIKNHIIEEVNSFIRSRDYYRKELRIPWKRGLLFYGPPGNGKSMMIRVLKNHFGLTTTDLAENISGGQIHIDRNCTGTEEDEEEVAEILPTLLYIEDIDKEFPVIERGAATKIDDYPLCSLNRLLQFLDGVEALDGYLVVATSNERESAIVQPLISRPGRIDSIYEFPPPTDREVRLYLHHHNLTITDKGGNVTEEFVPRLSCLGSMAFVMRFVVDLKSKKQSNIIDRDVAIVHVEKLEKHRGGGSDNLDSIL